VKFVYGTPRLSYRKRIGPAGQATGHTGGVIGHNALRRWGMPGGPTAAEWPMAVSGQHTVGFTYSLGVAQGER